MTVNSVNESGFDRLAEFRLEDLHVDMLLKLDESEIADEGSWSLLSDLAAEMVAGNRDDSLINGFQWVLTELSIEGFRGVKELLVIKFDPMPGVTIFHGENGSGKSSITEALRMILEGKVGSTHLGSVGRVHEIWGSNDERSNGIDKSNVAAEFRDKNEPEVRLTVHVVFDGQTVKRKAILYHRGGGVVEFPEESPAWMRWNAALRASPAVFAYSELANELQKRDDLQTWLSACLAMDAAIREFNGAVATKQQKSRDALNELKLAKDRAEAQIRIVDDAARANTIQDVADIEWNLITERTEFEGWLSTHNLLERARTDKQLLPNLYEELLNFCILYAEKKNSWTSVVTENLTSDVATAITDLDKKVKQSHQGDNKEICPVCGMHDESWRIHLHDNALTLIQAGETAEALRSHVQSRNQKLLEPIRDCLSSLPADYQDQEVLSEANHLITEAEVQSASTDYLDAKVLETIDNLCVWIETESAKKLVETAMEFADLRHHWLCDRWEAIGPLVQKWETVHEEANLAEVWKKALTNWNLYLGRLRKERTSQLLDLISPPVTSLLGDVGIRIDILEVNKGDVKLILKNNLDEEVKLSHLSAGQRNALILGPILGTATGGIFQFCFLDDPVHAFDDFRVDQLAATLTKLGEQQSLILTTHDSRFVEYLRVYSPKNFCVILTSRDQQGAISLSKVEAPWRILLDHAGQLHVAAGDVITEVGLADISSLLRMALDESLEMMSLRYLATLRSDDREIHRLAFVSAMSIKNRINKLRDFLSMSPGQLAAFDSAYGHVSGHVKGWSSSTHESSKAPSATELATQIAAATMTCSLLESIRW
jgi:energy-coupling factor transporter ATP-binding protein EcfA2